MIVEFWLLGTHRGALLGVEPRPAREFPLPDDRVLPVRGRPRLVCERVYFDAGTILRQLTA